MSHENIRNSDFCFIKFYWNAAMFAHADGLCLLSSCGDRLESL